MWERRPCAIPNALGLENGLHDPRWTTVVRVCQALEIPVAIGGAEVA